MSLHPGFEPERATSASRSSIRKFLVNQLIQFVKELFLTYLEGCTTCAEVLDWLCQLTGKSRSEPLYSEHITLGFIVPATHPAYRLWMEIDDGGNESFYRLPVVAWKVVMDAFERKYTNAEPITEYFEGEVAANSASMVIYNTLPAEEYLGQFDRGYTHAEASAAEVLRDRIVFLKGIAAKRTEKKQSA